MSKRIFKNIVYNAVVDYMREEGKKSTSVTDEELDAFICRALSAIFPRYFHPYTYRGNEDIEWVYNYVFQTVKSEASNSIGLVKKDFSLPVFKSDDLADASKMEDIIDVAVAYYDYLTGDDKPLDNITIEKNIVQVVYDVIDETEYVDNGYGRKVFTDSAQKAYSIIVDAVRKIVFGLTSDSNSRIWRR